MTAGLYEGATFYFMLTIPPSYPFYGEAVRRWFWYRTCGQIAHLFATVVVAFILFVTAVLLFSVLQRSVRRVARDSLRVEHCLVPTSSQQQKATCIGCTAHPSTQRIAAQHSMVCMPCAMHAAASCSPGVSLAWHALEALDLFSSIAIWNVAPPTRYHRYPNNLTDRPPPPPPPLLM